MTLGDSVTTRTRLPRGVRRAMAVTAGVAVMLAGIVVIDRDHFGSVGMSALPGATGQPAPTGPTGGGSGGGMGGPPFPLQPPDMPSGPPDGYNSGAYPAPDQGNGVSIYNSDAPQSPGSQGYSQAPNYPQQLQPANGTQPPNYEGPLQTAAQSSAAPSPAPDSATPQQTPPSQVHQPAQQDDQQNQDHQQSDGKQQDRQCATSSQGIGAGKNGQIAYSSTSQYAQAVSSAVASWNKLSKTLMSPVRGGDAPTLVIKDVDEPNAKWRGEYARPHDGHPAEISINTAFLKDASPQLIQGLIAHELGHALGLLDSSSEGSLMETSPLALCRHQSMQLPLLGQIPPVHRAQELVRHPTNTTASLAVKTRTEAAAHSMIFEERTSTEGGSAHHQAQSGFTKTTRTRRSPSRRTPKCAKQAQAIRGAAGS